MIVTGLAVAAGYWFWRGGRADSAGDAARSIRADSKSAPERFANAFTGLGYEIAGPSGGFDLDRTLADVGLQRVNAPPPARREARDDDIIARAVEALRGR